MTVEKLKKLLEEADEKREIRGNEFGNFVLTQEGIFIGYIDAETELFDLIEEETE